VILESIILAANLNEQDSHITNTTDPKMNNFILMASKAYTPYTVLCSKCEEYRFQHAA